MKKRLGSDRRDSVSSKRRLAPGDKPKRPSRPTTRGGTSKQTKRPARRPPPSGGSSADRRSDKQKRRIKPSLRAANRRTKVQSRPMPKPPARRPVAHRGGSSRQTVSEELRSQMDAVESRFEQLESAAQLSQIYTAIGGFDKKLVEYPLTIDALRDRGYVHSGQIEDKLEALDDRWDEVRPRVERALAQQVQRLDSELEQTEQQMTNLKPNASSIRTVETAVGGLSRRIDAAVDAVEGLYEGMEMDLEAVGYEIDRLAAMLQRFEESPEIRLYEAEGPLLSVPSVWQQDGKEGPEGVLFLTDQRLMFEQREEVVTKRKLGIFKSESEKIQKLLIEVQTSEIESTSHKEEGGFLGMGKDDILEFVFTDTAPLTRARFHLKGQDSSDWAAMVKRVQTGEIDDDRAEAYVEEMETAEETAALFPTQCPNCFAPLPTPPRGVKSVTCEFCDAVIQPERPA